MIIRPLFVLINKIKSISLFNESEYILEWAVMRPATPASDDLTFDCM